MTDHQESAESMRRRRSVWNTSSWSPARSSFAPIRRPAGPGDRRFAPTEHLAPEAVAAFVDGELGMTAHMRATHHLALCPECVAAVDAQTAARARLRSSGTVSIPTGLLGQLSQIPTREFDMREQAARDMRDQAARARGQAGAHGDPALPDEAVRGRAGEGRRADGPTDLPGTPPVTRGRMNRWRGR